MLNTDELFKLAVNEAIEIFGKQYLQENYANTCRACGIIAPDKYQFFIGIKGKTDLPERNCNDKGWVVYALIYLDAHTGKVIEKEYAIE